MYPLLLKASGFTGGLLLIGNGLLFQPFGCCNEESIMPREPVNGREPDFTEDDQREELGPRGVPGKSDPAKMTPQRDKKTVRFPRRMLVGAGQVGCGHSCQPADQPKQGLMLRS
jgi:hypothetical protein